MPQPQPRLTFSTKPRKPCQKKKDPPFLTSGDLRLIYAGVRACSLALSTLYEDPEGTRDPTRHELAKSVLNEWGVNWVSRIKPTEEEEKPQLVWPPVDLSGRPLAATLNLAYFKVYYRVHEKAVIRTPAHSADALCLHPSNQLELLGAYWDEKSHAWRMNFSTNDIDFWIDHCSVNPAEPIPDPEPATTIDIPPGAGL